MMAETKDVEKGKKPGKAPKTRAVYSSKDSNLFGRRDFFVLTAWSGFVGLLGAMSLAFLKFMFPRVLFEPSSVFKAGFPEEYIPGTVSERWKKTQRVWIVRGNDGSFYALLAKCTHLGCTPRWLEVENKFKCPCHGSGFRRSGVNYEGPAPRPLERAKIVLAEDGQLLIDKSVKFLHEQGEWGEPGSSLIV